MPTGPFGPRTGTVRIDRRRMPTMLSVPRSSSSSPASQTTRGRPLSSVRRVDGPADLRQGVLHALVVEVAGGDDLPLVDARRPRG